VANTALLWAQPAPIRYPTDAVPHFGSRLLVSSRGRGPRLLLLTRTEPQAPRKENAA
jgi:hypothetical protein